jgi:hypothetical protein
MTAENASRFSISAVIDRRYSTCEIARDGLRLSPPKDAS